MAAGCDTCEGTGKAGLYVYHRCYKCGASGKSKKSRSVSLAETRYNQRTRCRAKRQARENGNRILTGRLVPSGAGR